MAKQWIAFLGSLLVLGLSARAEAKAPSFDPVSIKERVSYRLVKQEKAYRVENPTYEAAFTEKGLCFVPLIREGVNGEEMGFSLKAVHGGDEALFFTKKAFTVKENRITYPLTQPVEEVYIAREDGIEQVFHVKAPLSSKEVDLVLTVALETELRPAAAREGIGFFDAKGCKVATYGAVTVFDAKGKEITFLPELREGHIALVVPRAFLKDAAYPVTVDPLIGSDFAICNQGDGQYHPAIAFDGNNYLVVWEDNRFGVNDLDIRGQLVTTGGVLVGENFYICNESHHQYEPAIAFDGNNYLVVWEDDRFGVNDTDIYGQRVTTDGGLLGGNFYICQPPNNQYRSAIAFDGNNYLVVWEDRRNASRDIYGQRVSAVGGRVGGNFCICNEGHAQVGPVIAFDGYNCLVAWCDYRNASLDIYGQQVDRSGGRVGGNFYICNEGHNQSWPAIAFDDNNCLVVWQDDRNASLDIYGQRVHFSWTKVSGGNPENMEDWGELAVDFASAGLWNFDDSAGTWSKLSGENPENMVEWVFRGLAVDFGGGGLWHFR